VRQAPLAALGAAHAQRPRGIARGRGAVVDRRSASIQRLDVDERRRRLLELGADIFTRHSYADISMAAIAREAGISKALLYHYFPSKQAYFVATLEQRAEELARRIAVDPALPPLEQLTRSLDAFLGWVEANADGYGKLLEGATTHGEVRELVDRVRSGTAEQLLVGLSPDSPPPPALRAAVHGWLWFMDGTLMDWLEHRDYERPQLLAVLLGALLGAVEATRPS
jgi:AcrR family transcriptional regulator